MPLLLSILLMLMVVMVGDGDGDGGVAADTLVAWLTPIYQQQMRQRARF